ncbi:PTS sugar transporter subunit IIA [Clostridium neuense]|uniref:PTS sugar transporter subunit IIA n=1 Tax=Clostridium neuense TaxID=1728934 RepID=A0ABW8TCM6_9CLOT
MRNIIIATHGELAKGLRFSTEFIMGEQKTLHVIPAYTSECPDFKNKLHELIEKYIEEGEVIILTDLFGGSVNTEVMNLLNKYKNVFLIAGANLSLVIQLLAANDDTNIRDVIEKGVKEARKGIIFCNNLIDCDEEAQLDEF